MNTAFEDMLCLFAAGTHGYEAEINHEIDVLKIRKLAIEQGVWPVVFVAMERKFNLSEYKKEFLMTVVSGLKRRDFQLKVIERLEKEGIECCLIKGITVARFYTEPDCRISGDTDILIKESDEKQTANILRECGYTIEPRKKNDHHMKAIHPVGGLLEVHVSLYSIPTNEIVFGNMLKYTEPLMSVDFGGHRVHTLSINDGLLYLTTHYIKHLLNNGGGVRQIMDLLLYIKHYEKEIDWDMYLKVLKEMNFDRLFEAIKGIGKEYLGFDFEYKSDLNSVKKLLEDAERVGLFGHNDDVVNKFTREFYRKKSQKSERQYKNYMMLNAETSIFDRIFPKQNVLITTGFGYARIKVLIPVAWMHRLFVVAARRLRGENEIKNNSKNHTDEAYISGKMELMRDLGIIDKE